MDIRSFLIEVVQPTGFEKKSVVLCTAKTYPLLFFAFLKRSIKERNAHTLIFLDLEHYEEHQIKAQLETSFLGMRQWYWLGDLSQCTTTTQAMWLEYCRTYQGPHCVFLFSCQTDLAMQHAHRVQVVDLDSFRPDQDAAYVLKAFFGEKYLPTWTSIEKKMSGASLETTCMVQSYVPVVGANADRFLAEWVDGLIAPDASLFALSTHFFAKKKKPFYNLWSTLHQSYAPQFWVSYWSEQLIKAYGFIHYTEQQQYVDAKKIAYRLPFSFMKTDWQKLSLHELQSAHAYIYQLDYDMKNGATDRALDVFYARFFDGVFASSKA